MRACLEWIPRLEAEEAIAAAECVAVGTGALANPRAVADAWGRLARGEAAQGPPASSGRAPGRRPALFSDEVLARLPVRRVPVRKG